MPLKQCITYYHHHLNQMTLVQQCFVQSLLTKCDSLIEKQERQAKENLVKTIDQVYQLFKQNIRDAFLNYSLDSIIRFTEISVEIPQRFDYASEMIDLFFQRVQSTNQFYIRGLLVKAKVVAYYAQSTSQKGEDMLISLKQSISYILKALDLISPQQENAPKGKDPKGAPAAGQSNKTKYAFLIYNASTTLYKVTRFILRSGWQKFFVDVYERIYKLLEEVDEADHNWRCRFTLILYQCLYDCERKPDAFKVLDMLWDRTKNKPCEFQDSLFRLRVYLCKQNNALAATIKKDIEGADPNGWKVLEVLQRMRTGLILEAQIQKELMTVINQISLGVLSNNETNNTAQLSPIMQERLAQAGRIAMRFNLTNLGSSIVTFLGKTRQPGQKALILNEYNKAELLIKKKGEHVDKKTGMSMSAAQIKQLDIQNRKQALKIMEKVMLINKKLDSAELIYEGAVLVWNIALPFLTETYHSFAARALDLSLALVEQIDSNDHDLRTKFHLQLINIYFSNDLMFSEVESNVFKALRLDPSIPTAKLAIKPEPEEDPSLYARPYHRYLLDFRQKVLLKTMQVINPNPLDMVTQDLWTIEDHKSQTTKIDTLQKCLRALITYEEPPFKVDPQEMLVEEEIKKKKLDYDRQKLRSYKRRKLLASEIAKLSFQWELNDFAKKACEIVLADAWDVKNSIQLIISQGHCCLYLTQIKIDQFYQENYEPLFEEEPNNAELGQLKAKQIKDRKGQVLAYFRRALEYALITQQNYLIFNGAICLWNNFLHIFKVTANDTKLRPDLTPLLKDYFQAMRNSLKQIETKNITYYDLDDKIQAFSNVGLVYARLLQSQKQTALVEKVCEDLLLTNLSPNTRKLINGIKARVGGGKAGGAKPADPKKGAPPPQKAPGFNDTFILQISNQLQLIQNTANIADCQTQVIKCFEGLQSWKPNEQDESELELHAELWVKLARLASNQQNSKMLKYSLRCAEKALVQSKVGDPSNIPSNRLRWYSLAQFLSSQSLLKLVNPKTQESASVENLLFLSLTRGVEAATKGFKCGINILVLDAGKQVWNVCSKLQESKSNRSKLVQPIHSILTFLKELKEDSETDLLLLLSQLYFKATWENNLFKEGEEVADMMLDLLPKGLQKSIWEAKMSFMSKQGKNQLQAISSIKEAQPSLQAKLWVKLARIAPNPSKQQAAYSKALEILKKQHSVQIVEVLIEYSEWQLRVGKQPIETIIKNLEYASNMLIEIEYDHEIEQEEGQGEGQDDQMTINSQSRSRKSKKSMVSKSIKSSQKDIKNKQDKKGTFSGKSKGSGLSRMNRSGRAAKTIKNKNTKSVFSQREEEANPESLNCLHFERLFRIFTILSAIQHEHSSKVSYALNAHRQVLNMLQKSGSTFNELQQNAAKLNEKQEKFTYKAVVWPETTDEWIGYELPKQYIQKISKVQNLSFLGNYTLQKPELTYAYLCKLINLLTDLGLDYHTLPLRFLAKYITRYILKSESYHILEELKLKRVLMTNKHPLESQVKIDFQNLKISEEEIKDQLLKAEYQRGNLSQNTNSFDTVSAPNVIPPLSRHECWYEMGKTLIEFGQINSAKNYLKQSLKCAKVLSNSQQIGKIHTYLSEIAYFQGENQEAVQHLLLAHRLCKSSSNWQKVIVLASQIMIAIKKYDILKSFLQKIHTTVSQLIEQSLKKTKEGSGFRIEVFELKQLIIAVEIGLVNLTYKQIVDEDSPENRQSFSSSIDNLLKTLEDKSRALWNRENYHFLITVFSEIIDLYEKKGGNSLLYLGTENFNKIFNILKQLQRMIKDFVSSVGISDSDGGNYNSIIDTQIQMGFLLISCYCLDFKSKSDSEGELSSNDPSLEEDNQQLQKYLQQIDQEIKKTTTPAPSQLNQLEMAVTILNDLEIHVAQNSAYYPRLLAINAYVQTLMSSSSSHALQAADLFKTKAEERLDKYESDIDCYLYQWKVYESLVDQQIQGLPAESFESLAKMQHASSVLTSFSFLKKKLSPNHKMLSFVRIINYINSKETAAVLIQRQRIFSSLTKVPTFSQSVKLMPKNSAYVIIQLSKCKSKMFYGCLINQPESNTKKTFAKVRQIGLKQLKNYKNLGEIMLQCKKDLIKTPIENEQKLNTILDNNEIKLKEVQTSLQSISAWWLHDLLQYLKTPRNVPVPTNEKDKKGGKDQKKKGGKDQIGGYESPLPPSPSGIQSVTFLLDDFVYGLPYQQLLPVDVIATVSKDNSLFWLSRKLQQIGFQPQLNNSNGYGADKGKYCAYDFKSPQNNFKTISTELAKGPEVCKFDGIDSQTRLPSLGDYSKFLLEPGFLQVYGSIDLLNHVKLNSLFELIGLNKLRLLLIHDNLNFSKSIIHKYKDLNTDSITSTLQESELAISVISNLLNLTVIKNRWFVQPSNTLQLIKNTYKTLAGGNYLGSTLRQGRKSEDTMSSKWMCYLHGPPVTRI